MIPVVKRAPLEQSMIEYPGFNHGLNTSAASFALLPTEVSELVNFKILRDGSTETRQGIVRYTTAPTTSYAAVKTIATAVISGVVRELIVDSNHVLYYLNSSLQPVTIGTLEGPTKIISYNNVAILLDGSYIKYLSGVTGINIAYDNGSGLTGFQFSNRSGTKDTSYAVGDGSVSRLAYKFTAKSWDAGYTIPPTTVYAYLSKTGSPAGTASMVIRLASDSSILATKTIVSDVSTITGVAAEYYATFAASDVTTNLSPGVDYFASIEYSAGDASNYINVHLTNVSTGGHGYRYSSSWVNDPADDPCMGLKPGVAPKGSFGALCNQRLFVAGDEDNPGLTWYGNRSHLDWSTTDLGGYVTAVDDSNTSFPIGGMESLYGELFVFGTKDQPYICKLTGATPSEYALPVLFQQSWTTSSTLVSTGNDLWFSSEDGTDALSGVTEYGDLRTSNFSAPVDDRFLDYWSSGAVTGYNPRDGQYMIQFPGYSRTLVCHVKSPVAMSDGKPRYPWAEYEFTKDILTSASYQWYDNNGEWFLRSSSGGAPGLTKKPDHIFLNDSILTEGTLGALNENEWAYGLDPSMSYYTVYLKATEALGSTDTTNAGFDYVFNPNAFLFGSSTGISDTGDNIIRSVLEPQCFASYGSKFLIGGSDGYIYKLDPAEYKDMSAHHMRFDLRGRYSESSFGKLIIDGYKLVCSGLMGGQLTMKIYRDDSFSTNFYSSTVVLSMDDRLTVDMLTGDVDDAVYGMDAEQSTTSKRVQMLCRSIQPRVTDIYLSGKPLNIKGIALKFRKAEM